MNPNSNQPQNNNFPTPSISPPTRWIPATNDPGYTLFWIGIVMSFLVGPFSIIPFIMSKNKSKAAGYKNKLVSLSIVLDIITLTIVIMALALSIAIVIWG